LEDALGTLLLFDHSLEYMSEREIIIHGLFQFTDHVRFMWTQKTTYEANGITYPVIFDHAEIYKGGDPELDKLPIRSYAEWEQLLEARNPRPKYKGPPWRRPDGSTDVKLLLLYGPDPPVCYEPIHRARQTRLGDEDLEC
jgi:hypothetical protein